MDLVRIRTIVDEIHAEGSGQVATPLRKVAAGAVIKNPFAGRTVEDITGEDGLT